MVRFTRVTPRVPVTDLRRTIEFYTEHLGFGLGSESPHDGPTFCLLDRGPVRIGFFEAESDDGSAATGGCDLYIDVEDVRALHDSIRETVPVEWGPEVHFCGRREFAIKDPDGYLLIFAEETEDPPTCPEEE
jgi:catechol 2,3-dioxygenase-like lactoylglutathione lyase family enzyme